MSTEHLWNDNEKGKLKYINKNLFRAILSTINPTQIGLGLNLDLLGT